MANQLGVAEQQAIITLVKHGWSRRRIARELGIHRETVSRYVRLPADPRRGHAHPRHHTFASRQSVHGSRTPSVVAVAGGTHGGPIPETASRLGADPPSLASLQRSARTFYRRVRPGRTYCFSPVYPVGAMR
ncbi:MAG: helix-turn-helix domain-containing protein [Phycisphaerales bacterium]|nr:MAG: helix-turn-helix domain-containing protein [Phycisphaerales bacterium]